MRWGIIQSLRAFLHSLDPFRSSKSTNLLHPPVQFAVLRRLPQCLLNTTALDVLEAIAELLIANLPGLDDLSRRALADIDILLPFQCAP